jgi:hypothetical protein
VTRLSKSTHCLLWGTILGGVVLPGCRGGGIARVDDQKQPFNRWTLETLDDESINNAIASQHTLYPYHFMDNSPELNPVGERDVKVLADVLRRRPGEINVRHGSEPADLYEARVQTVTQLLTKFGVSASSIRVGDKPPGGEGVASERAVIILQRSYENQALTQDGSSGSSGSSTTGESGTSSHSTQGGTH